MSETDIDQMVAILPPEIPYFDRPDNFPHDHQEIAWSHFLAQFKDGTKLDGFVKSFYLPFNYLDKALNDLLTKRGVLTSEGVQLDGVGNIVGIKRTADNAKFLAFFGFITQPSGRAFGVARMRRDREPYTEDVVLGDTDYRNLILRKIKYNSAHGTTEEIIAALNANTGTTSAVVTDGGNAEVTATIGYIAPADPKYPFLMYMVPVAQGVKFTLTILPP